MGSHSNSESPKPNGENGGTERSYRCASTILNSCPSNIVRLLNAELLVVLNGTSPFFLAARQLLILDPGDYSAEHEHTHIL